MHLYSFSATTNGDLAFGNINIASSGICLYLSNKPVFEYNDARDWNTFRYPYFQFGFGCPLMMATSYPQDFIS